METIQGRLSSRDLPGETIYGRMSRETTQWRFSRGYCPGDTIQGRLSKRDCLGDIAQRRLSGGDCLGAFSARCADLLAKSSELVQLRIMCPAMAHVRANWVLTSREGDGNQCRVREHQGSTPNKTV